MSGVRFLGCLLYEAAWSGYAVHAQMLTCLLLILVLQHMFTYISGGNTSNLTAAVELCLMLPYRLSCFLDASLSMMVNMSAVYMDLHTLHLSCMTQVDEESHQDAASIASGGPIRV